MGGMWVVLAKRLFGGKGWDGHFLKVEGAIGGGGVGWAQ